MTDNKVIVLSYIDPRGDMRETDKLRFDGANYYPIYEPCEKAFALVYSREMTRARIDAAKRLAEDKRADGYICVRVRVMADVDSVLEFARKTARNKGE